MPVCACGCSEEGKLVLAFGVDAAELGFVNTGRWSTATVAKGKPVGTGICSALHLHGTDLPLCSDCEWAALRLCG